MRGDRMKKRTYSVFLAFGASVFLFSEHALAQTVIYDPLDPKNAITPIANEEVRQEDNQDQKNDQKTSGQLELEHKKDQTVKSPPKKIVSQSGKNKEVLAENSSYATLKNPTLKSKRTPKWAENPAYIPPYHAQGKNNVLILDDEFFAPKAIATLPPEGNPQAGSAINEWTEIAQSAYLLSGLVLYGDQSLQLVTRGNEFAG